MGQIEGTQLVSSTTVGHISSQVVESRGAEKNTLPEQELYVTSCVKKRCFSCHDTSHNLEQCGTKYKHTIVAHQFGYATKYPFTMIQPSEETVHKEKFDHHCVLITSNLSNLDQGILKSELLKFWKLSGDWELRRECNKSFLVSFSSKDDAISCLKHPKMETLLDGKEVNFTVTRLNENDDRNLDLVEEWLLVSGVPRIYRNWKELYQVASAFGVLIDVDEKTLEVGDKEPIRMKIAFRSFDGAPFSYYFAFGWSSKLVMVTPVQEKTEGMKHKNKELEKEHIKELHAAKIISLEEPKGIEESRSNGKAKENKINAPAATVTNSEITTTETSKLKGVQSVAPSPRRKIGEEHFRGIQKPPIKHAFKRRGKKQQVTEAINKSPSNNMDSEVAPHSSSKVTRTGASTGCDMLDEKDCSEMRPKRKQNMEEITPVEESKKSQKLGAWREVEYNNVAAPKINAKKSQISGDTSRTTKDEVITRHTEDVGMDQMGSGLQVHKKQEHTFGLLEIQRLAEILNVSMEDAEKIHTGQIEIDKATVAYEYRKGKDLLATKREINELSPAMRQLHDYYLVDTVKAGCSSFGVCIPKHYIFEKEEETHWVEYETLFQLFQRRDLDHQIMMMWTLLEAKYCLKKGLDHIAFLDPVRVNGNTCKGINCDVKDLVDELTKIFYRIKHKSNILLAYNCTGHYVLIDIKLAETRVEAWDSKRRELSYIDDLLKVLNDVKKNMDGDMMMIQFEAHPMEAHTLEQPMANNNCGFYVMWAMHEYLGRNMIEGNQMRNELQTQQLLDMEIRGFQDELAQFINDEVMTREGSFSIWQAKNRSSFEINMF